MRAAVIGAFGKVPRIADVPEPASGTVARVICATLTPVDRVVVAGRFLPDVAFPFVPGKEGVAAIGARHVYFEVPPHAGGAFAERIALPERAFAVDLPPGIDPREAAALGGSTGITAWMALEHTAKLRAGERVLVLGATGAVGLAAIGIAKLLGAAHVTAAGRDAARMDACRAAGADAVVGVAAAGDDLAAAFRAATGGGPDVIFDPLSGPQALAALHAARSGARLVRIGNASNDDLPVPTTLLLRGALTIAGYANFSAPAEQRAAAYRRILDALARGSLRAAYRSHLLDDIASVWEAAQASPRVLIEP